MAQNDPWAAFETVEQPASMGVTTIVPGQPKQDDPPSGYRWGPPGPDGQPTLLPIEGGPAAEGEGDGLKTESDLRKEFTARPEVKKFADIRNSYFQIRDLAAEPSAMGDLGLIFSYMKMLDPGSVVREGEFATAQNAAGIPDRIRNLYNKALSGERMNNDQRAGMVKAAETIFTRQIQTYNNVAKEYRDYAQSYGVEPDRVAKLTELEKGAGGSAKEPETRGGVPVGTEIQFNVDAPEGPFDRGEYLQENYGITPNQEALALGFWNANRGNTNLTVEAARDWYQGKGLPPPSDEDLARAVEEARAGNQFGPLDTSGAEAEYTRQLDERLQQRGADPESFSGALGVNAAQGALWGGLDEVAGAGGFVGAAMRGQDPIAGYQAERDTIRREEQRAEAARPWLSASSELIGTIPTAGLGFNQAARAGRLASQAARMGNTGRAATLGRETARASMKPGAITGGAYGFNTGEGASDSAIGAADVTAAGAALAPVGAWGGQKLLNKIASPKAAAPRESAQRVAAAENFGIDLPMGATNRAAAGFEKGLDLLPGSAGVMQEARNKLGGEVTQAVDNVAGQFGPTTSYTGVGEAAQRGANKWISKFEETSAKAYDAIPVSPKAPADLANTRGALESLTSRFQSNPKLADAMRNTRLDRYMDALGDKTSSLSWEDLKAFRSRIGEEIGDQRFSDGTLKSELRSLYGALSEDMKATAAAQGPKALRAFERANDLYRKGQERIDTALISILGNDARKSPEAAAKALQNIATSGKATSDIKKLAKIRASMPKEEWGEVSNGLIRLLGQPVNSEGREFSAQTFIKNYDDMGSAAKNLLFGDRGRKQLRESLDEFSGVMRNLAESDALRNTSNTANTVNAAALITSGPAALMNPVIAAGIGGQALGSFGLARLWTNPRFVRWATGYAKMVRGAQKAGGQPNVGRQLELLQKVAAAEPALAAEIGGLRQSIINAANDNLSQTTPAVASDVENRQNEGAQ